MCKTDRVNYSSTWEPNNEKRGKAMFDVITIGGATRDVFFMTDQAKILGDRTGKNHRKYVAFEYGAKIIPEEAEFAFGGGGANSAVSFSKMGLKTAAVLRVGSDGTGNHVIDDLKENGVDCRFIEKDKKNHTALSMILSIPGSDHTMFLYRGANDFLNIPDWRDFRSSWFYISSLTGESEDLLPEIFSYARAHNIKVAWNPGSEQIKKGFDDLEQMLENTSVLSINREEAILLALSKDNRVNYNDEKALLACLNEMTGGIILMTDGENGSYATDGEKDYYEPTAGCEAIETTGAGDAYGSTFIACLIKGMQIKEAMKLASVNSASVVSYVGAQKGLMTFDELRVKI